jgi:putative endonuclease
MNEWFVYLVRCKDNSLYTGITTDLERRIHEHNHDNKQAASYTRARRPVALVYWESAATRAQALSREASLKQLSKPQKEALVVGFKPQ